MKRMILELDDDIFDAFVQEYEELDRENNNRAAGYTFEKYMNDVLRDEVTRMETGIHPEDDPNTMKRIIHAFEGGKKYMTTHDIKAVIDEDSR
jgi:hypothetical protein